MDIPEIYYKIAEEALHKLCDGCIRDSCFQDLLPMELRTRCVCEFPQEFFENEALPTFDSEKHYSENGEMKCKNRLENWKLWNQYLGGEG